MATPDRFTGGMNVPWVIGRANASIPLAELVVDNQELTLRPRGLGKLMITPFVVELWQIDAAFLLRGHLWASGVGIRLRNGVVAYFWTWNKQAPVLAALEARGILIEPGRHSARHLWRWRATPEAAAALPTMPALLRSLTPALILVGTAVAVVLLVTSEFWWARAWIALVWAASSASLGMAWWRARSRDGSS